MSRTTPLAARPRFGQRRGRLQHPAAWRWRLVQRQSRRAGRAGGLDRRRAGESRPHLSRAGFRPPRHDRLGAALREGRVDRRLCRPARAGDYFIEVRDGSNDGRSIQPAVLTTRFTPTTLSYEPDDTFGTATRGSARRLERRLHPAERRRRLAGVLCARTRQARRYGRRSAGGTRRRRPRRSTASSAI